MSFRLLDGIRKIAISTLGGAALGFGGGALAMALIDPYIRKTIKAGIEIETSKKKSDAHKYKTGFNPPPEAERNADAMAQSLLQKGFDPQKGSVAITGVAGVGKTTHAKLLAKKLNMVVGKESQRALQSGKSFSRNLGNSGVAVPGTIYEQTHLLHNTNPSMFDALIHLQRPRSAIYKDLKNRERGAINRRYADYPLLDETIQHAFDASKGKESSPAPGAKLKMRPDSGFNTDQNISDKLVAMGYTAGNIDKMSREQRLYALSGRIGRTKGIGKILGSEYKPKALAESAAILGASGLLGAVLASRR